MDLTRLDIFYTPIFNLLVLLYSTFWGNLGIAIILVALISKVITIPITLKQQQNASKTKELQAKMDEIKERYKNNPELQAKELAKHQGQLLSGSLGGCLPIIITIFVLLTVRSVIIDLVDRGWVAYNNVAYIESTKRKIDSVNTKLEQDLKIGQNQITYDFVTTSEKKYTKTVNIFVYENDGQKEEYKKKWGEIHQTELSSPSEISLYSKDFTFSNVDQHVITNRKPDLLFYIRPGSNEVLDSSKTKVSVNGVEVASQTSQGDPLNLDFLGLNISKVATSFSISDPEIIPYIVLSVLFALSSVYAQRQMMNQTAATPKKVDSKDPQAEMQNMMMKMNGQMMYIFTGITLITSLGFWGGAQLLPSGLSIFWTAQSLFGIIQSLIQAKYLKKDGSK